MPGKLTALLLIVVTAAHARADDPGSTTAAPSTQPALPPRADTGRTARRWFELDELRFEIGVDAEYHRQEVISDLGGRYGGRYRQLDEQYRFEETIGGSTRGSLFGPDALNFDLSGRWGLSQESFFEKRPGRDLESSPNGDVLEYDVGFELFPSGKVTATAFASQLDDRVPRMFQPSLDRHRERYGASLLYNDRVLPMRLTFEHSFDRLESGDEFLLDDEDFKRDRLEYEATWNISDTQSLRLRYEYEDQEEKYSGLGTRFDLRRHDVQLEHTLEFGDEQQHRLETLVRIEDESGDYARDALEFTPRLRLEHSDDFATTYQAQYLRETFEGLRVEQWRGDVGLVKQFGEHLTTNANLFAARVNNAQLGPGPDGGADSVEWGGNAGAAWSSENEYGRFSANLSYNHTAVHTSNGRQAGIVIAEAVTFRDPLPNFLAHANVRPASVLVTSADRSRVYVLGRDYLVTRVGGYTSLYRVRSGEINDRETVLVSYTYSVSSDYELSRDRLDFRMQQDFDSGFTPYYAFSLQDEDIDHDRYLRFEARNVNRHRVGVTYRERRWSAGIEYEYHDERIDPYEAVHLNADATLFESARQNLAGNVRASQFWFDGSDGLEPRDTFLLDLGASYRFLISRDTELNAAASYRYEDDTLFGQTHGVDLTGSLAHRIGLFTVLLEVEYDVLDLPTSSDEGFAVWLKLRREIPVFARAER